MTNYRLLLLLLLLVGWSPWALAQRRIFDTFEFTAKIYNLTIEENIRGKDVYAVSNSPIRVGVPLPDRFSNVEFRIVEGERTLFDAETRTVGNFAFLLLKFRRSSILNRELRDKYEFLIKAKCKRKDPPDLETMATVNLMVLDQNDAHPIFKANDYAVQVLENIKPMSDIIQVFATDADIDKNGEVYYSLLNDVPEFIVDPITGWIRNVKKLSHGKYDLKILAEDRASRLHRKKGRTSSLKTSTLELNKAKVTVTVLEAESAVPELKIEQRTIFLSLSNVSQIVAIIRCELQKDDELFLDLVRSEHEPYFKLTKDLVSNLWLLQSVPGYLPNRNWKAEVLAQINDDPSRITTTTIDVMVDETRIIKFADSVFKFSVNESAPIGYVVGKIYAVIKNGTHPDYEKLRYKIAFDTKNSSFPFSIDEDTGYIHVKNWLDFEALTEYKFAVLAQLDGYDSEDKAIVEIVLRDSNDHSPIFAAKWARGEPIAVDEKILLNTTIVTVEALDADIERNGLVKYMLIDAQNLPFSIDSNKGEIKLSRELPHGESSWRLKVRAFDSGWPYSRRSEMILTLYKNGTKTPNKHWPLISRDPVNSNSPIIYKPNYAVTVNEDVDVGKVIASVDATDADSGYAGVVRLSCMDEFFAIQPFSGKIFVLRNLHELFRRYNRTAHSIEYQLRIFAYDMGEPIRTSNTTLPITVQRCNSGPPQFEKPLYTIRVKEDLPVGAEIMVVKAFDADVGDNGKIGYKLTDFNNYIEVDETLGILRVREPLDYETNKKLSFAIEAYDYGKPPKLGFANVTVLLDDVNDNAPECVFGSQTVQVPEDYPNGALITCIPANDPDSGDNGRISYELFSTDVATVLPFRIQRDTGCVFLNTEEPLNFEYVAFYNLTVKLLDNGEPQLHGSCNLGIQLIDVNENLHPPQFSDFVYNFTISENVEAGSVVGKLVARDPEDEKSFLKYFIVGGDGVGHFTIDSEGVIRTNEILDHEVSSIYWLAVTAEDNAPIPLSSTIHVMVKVLNKNDHAPIPRRPIYFASVQENSPETFVAQVQADDKDELDRQDSLSDSGLTYQISGGDPQSFFHMEAKSGYLITHQTRLLDREKQKEHAIMIKICDGEQLCTKVPVVVAVKDLNDNQPVFTYEQYKFEVPPNTVGVLCRVFAVDLDEGNNALLTYTITGDGRFSIDNDGYISSSEGLKPDEAVTLSVKATEVVSPFGHSISRVTLTAVGKPLSTEKKLNQKPVVSNVEHLRHLSVIDSSHVGDIITYIQALDDDGDKLWWAITEGNTNNVFDLRNDTGALSLAKSLDFLDANVKMVKMKVAVSDGKDTVYAMVEVEILRDTMERPHFSATHYKTQVPESTTVGTLIYGLKATTSLDAHSPGSNYSITYSIKAVENVAAKNKFRIDSKTGNIFLASTLTKDVAREFSMIVCAVLHGYGASKSNYAMLTISLTNNKEVAPVFLQKNYNVTVLARLPIRSIIANVFANDADVGKSGTVSYSIVAGNEGDYFDINEETGEIRLSRSLLFSDRTSTVLTVRATDRSALKLSDKCFVHVKWVLDELLPPSFQRSMYSARISRAMPVGSLITVTGLRSPISGSQYYLDSACIFFDIHPLSGAVYLRRRLSIIESENRLNCTVFAKNAFGEKASTELVVKIVDTNENAPFFNQTVYVGFIDERRPAGSVVTERDGKPLTVFAYDKDTGLNGAVNYRIISPSEPFFMIDFVTGVIRTKCPLDYEKISTWSFYVQASDMGVPSLSSAVPALVTVFVGDVNDVAPKFTSRKIFTHLLLPTLRGVEITKAVAHDPDAVGILRYRLKENSDLFAVNSKTGVITVNTDDSDLFTADQYKVSVVVDDGIHEDSVLVIIAVKNLSKESQKLNIAIDNKRISIVENTVAAVPQILTTLTVIGLGKGQTVEYRILNPHPNFSVGIRSGQIMWHGNALDREDTPQIKLLLEASIDVENTTRIQQVVTIDVEDVNDCSPIFVDLPYNAVVPVDASVGYKILTVKAVDADEGFNGVVRYFMRSHNKYIRLNKYDGRITVVKPMEASSLLTDMFSFIVDAYDQGVPNRSSSANVTIKIIPSGVPVFTKKVYDLKVLENVAVDTAVVTVEAVSDEKRGIGYLLDDGDAENEFFMDFKTGILRVRKSLDREHIDSYNLRIIAVTLNTGTVRGYCHVHIDVLDVNDNAPYFEKLLYQLVLSETTAIGTEIFKVKATDIDDSNEVITYSIKGEQSSVFMVDSVTGKIFLMENLDYETRKRYKLNLRATDDAGLYSETVLIITVEDANDNAPTVIFPPKVSINTDAVIGQYITRVKAYDTDTVANLEGSQKLIFSILGGDETIINLNNSNGIITLARDLEYRDFANSECQFNLSVSDGIHSVSGEFSLGFTLGHKLLPKIKFEKPIYEGTIQENEKVGITLTTVAATGGHKYVKYFIGDKTAGVGSWPVTVEELSGIVKTSRVFDYEEQKVYRIPLVAIDSIGRRDFAFLLLHITPENDNIPKFVSETYHLCSLNNTKEEEPVLIALAVDDDEDDQIRYYLESSNDLSSHVRVDQRSGIVSLRKLNRYRGKKLEFFVRAMDTASPPHKALARVTVCLVDSNVYLPRFSSNQYVFSADEGIQLNTVVGRLKISNKGKEKTLFALVNDADIADFPFSVDKESGNIIVVAPLSREKSPVWRFMVRAVSKVDTSTGSLALVTVTVTKSLSSVVPVTEWTRRVLVAEDTLVNTTIDLLAVDNLFCGYSLSLTDNDSSFFKIDAETGALSLANKLDREKQDNHTVTVVSSCDDGTFIRIIVTIIVLDVNDAAPTFDRSNYVFLISTDNKQIEGVKQIVGHLTYTDSDLPESNRIEMSIVEGNENHNFDINNNGTLYVMLDKITELPDVNNLSILVSDGRFYSTASVKIIKPNKGFTCYDMDYSVDLPEDSAIGTVIVPGFKQIPGDFRFRLNGGDEQFISLSANGTTVLRKYLDRENASQHNFTLLGESSDIVCMWTVLVTVIDINDEVPVFDKPKYTLTVKEDVTVTKNERFFLEKLTATDGDQGINGKIIYTFDDGVDAMVREKFDLDENTGVLSLISSLDREKREMYSFVVRAIDGGGKWSTAFDVSAEVIINVIDVNDNEPVFVSAKYEFEVSESAVPGYEIGSVRAFDQDRSDHITYNIEDSPEVKYVHLDQSTGILELLTPFDYETVKSITLTISATDSGEPPLKSTCTVEIKVLDVNDNPPKFSQSSYKKVINENAAIGTRVIRMVATDADSDRFNLITFSMLGGAGLFKILEDGWVVVNGKLDRERQEGYRLQVIATDNGNPPLSASTEVTITLEDSNDNPPVITPCNLTVSVQENEEPGYVLTKVTVTDDDTVSNGGPFRLIIEGHGSESFGFDADYNLVVKSRLSYSKKTLYLLNVIAYDQGNLSSECPLTINVKQESLHPPEVMPLKISLNILMDEYLGGKIGVITARDKDSADLLRYNISDDASSLFSVSSSTGEIFARPGLTASVYDFSVNVTDGKYTVQTNVTVDVYSITQTALDHAVSMRFFNITAEKFLSELLPVLEEEFIYLGKFRLLSLQESEISPEEESISFGHPYVQSHVRRIRKHRRDILHTISILDVLMVITDSYDYLRPEIISRKFSTSAVIHEIKVNITTEVCNSNTCVNGECIGRLYLEESAFPLYSFNNKVFSAPRHNRTFECICREGFGGKRCSIPINKCSTNPCRIPDSGSDLMMCIPTETLLGYECSCPPGRTGRLCNLPDCGKSYAECSKYSEISVNGRSFFQILVSSSLEESLRLSFQFRTVSSDAVVMHGAGDTNYHMLELQKGYMQYHWDCGSGIGVVNGSGVFVADGAWHRVEINRFGRSSSLKIDDRSFQGLSPLGGKVLNLRHDAVRLTFGGKVELPVLENDDKFNPLPTITRGMIGCFGLITVDSDELPKTKQGMRLYNTKMGCIAMKGDPCLHNPCKNGGSCHSNGPNGYSCTCTNAYSGTNCELLAPCDGDPCGGRGLCTNSGLSYFCACMDGYTGRNCEIPVLWSYCTGSMCGSFGRCIRQSNGFYYCNCSHGYSGRYCNEPPPNVFFETTPRVDWLILTIFVGIIVLVIVVIFLFCVWFIPHCKRNMKGRRTAFVSEKRSNGDPCKTPFLNNFNNKISEPEPAPPIPPRRPIIRGQNAPNVHPIPTAEVRPYDKNEPCIHGSRSPSIAEAPFAKPKRVLNTSKRPDQTKSYGLHRYGRKISEGDSSERYNWREESEGDSSSDGSEERSLKNPCSRRRGHQPRTRHRRFNGNQDSVPLRSEHVECKGTTGPIHDGVPENCKYVIHDAVNSRNASIPDQTLESEYVPFSPPDRRTFTLEDDRTRHLLDSNNDSEGTGEYVYPDEIPRKPPPPVHRHAPNEVVLEDGNRVYDNPATEGVVPKEKFAKASDGAEPTLKDFPPEVSDEPGGREELGQERC